MFLLMITNVCRHVRLWHLCIANEFDLIFTFGVSYELTHSVANSVGGKMSS